jgi:hypothetical protein
VAGTRLGSRKRATTRFTTNDMDYVTAIDSGNPSQIERDLRWYHDSVVENGGEVYSRVWTNHYENDPARRHLKRALTVGAGGIVVYTKGQGSPDAEEGRTLHLKQLHPALYPTATRRKLATNADDKYYAILKTAKDGSERMVAAYNFQRTPQTVQVNLGVVDSPGRVDTQSAALIVQLDQFHPVAVELPAYGYRFLTVLSRSKLALERKVGATSSGSRGARLPLKL